VSLPEQKYKTSAERDVSCATSWRALRIVRRPARGRRVWAPARRYLGASSSFTRTDETIQPTLPRPGCGRHAGLFQHHEDSAQERRAFDAHDDETGRKSWRSMRKPRAATWPNVNPLGQQLRLAVSLAEARSGMKTVVAVVATSGPGA